MANFRVFDGADGFWDIPLDRPRIIIGRDPNCADVHLKDPTISRMHAVVVVTPQQITVRDMNSTSGTYVNDTRIKEIVLRDGMTIRMGKTMMSFMNRSPLPPVLLDQLASSNEDGDVMATICGHTQRFLTLPPGMGLNIKQVFVPSQMVFSPGDTIVLGSGGISIPNFLHLDNKAISEQIFEMKFIWPDGTEKIFPGEVVQIFRAIMCVKLHRLPPNTLQQIVLSHRRSSWWTVIPIAKKYQYQ